MHRPIVTARLRRSPASWCTGLARRPLVPERMQNTIDLTAQGGTLDRELKADEVFTNEFNSKVMPAG